MRALGRWSVICDDLKASKTQPECSLVDAIAESLELATIHLIFAIDLVATARLSLVVDTTVAVVRLLQDESQGTIACGPGDRALRTIVGHLRNQRGKDIIVCTRLVTESPGDRTVAFRRGHRC